MKTLRELGLSVPEIVLPKKIDTAVWSVIACDQYTQNPQYWEKAAQTAGNKPSTLNLILPEIYLNAPDKTERIKKIRRTMQEYEKDGVFAAPEKELIYVERTTSYGRTRHGLIAAIDLDSYEWKPFSKALIRATEATILERIPPRKEIRKGAPLELPHIMLLVNDPEHILVEKAGEAAKNAEEKAGSTEKTRAAAYSGNLMMRGGSITGWSIKNGTEIAAVEKAVNKIAEQNTAADGSVFLFAVGDGNHSLATAKTVWEEYKAELKTAGKTDAEIESNPVRYALVEIVNIYDSGLTFEPIHRVLFGADVNKLTGFLQKKFGGTLSECKSQEKLVSAVKKSSANFGFVSMENGKTSYKLLESTVTELAVARLQPELDSFIADQKKSGTKIDIDYIHGSDEVFTLGKKDGAVSILLPPIAKDSFFATINKRGPLPRKSFSMGEADEKRFYMECRKLF